MANTLVNYGFSGFSGFSGITFTTESANKTVNFDNGMTNAAMQALINAVGKHIAYGATITFQFADGTYTTATELIWSGYFGGGNINIQGNAGESALHTNQAVILDCSAAAGNIRPIQIHDCAVPVAVANLKIIVNTNANYGRAVWTSHNSLTVTVRGCYCVGNGTGIQSYLIYFTYSTMCQVDTTYVENAYFGISARRVALVYSDGNDDTGTMPLYGLYALNGTTIVKNGTQPAGSTANELTDTGGLIR